MTEIKVRTLSGSELGAHVELTLDTGPAGRTSFGMSRRQRGREQRSGAI